MPPAPPWKKQGMWCVSSYYYYYYHHHYYYYCYLEEERDVVHL